MKILDLFAGLGGESRRAKIEARGHTYHTLDLDPEFKCTFTANILDITPQDLGYYDFIWASPPCEAFSVAKLSYHWDIGLKPKTEKAVFNQKIVAHTRFLIESINPRKGFLIENPRGMLRKLPPVQGLPRVTVTYCQYGEKRMKPTDLWGFVPNWTPKPPCKNGDKCHEAAPRGSRTGTQSPSLKNSAERAVVPWLLWEEILIAIEKE